MRSADRLRLFACSLVCLFVERERDWRGLERPGEGAGEAWRGSWSGAIREKQMWLTHSLGSDYHSGTWFRVPETGSYFGAVFQPYVCLSLAEYKIFIRASSEAKSMPKFAS